MKRLTKPLLKKVSTFFGELQTDMKFILTLIVFMALIPVASFAQNLNNEVITAVNHVFSKNNAIKGEVVVNNRIIKTILKHSNYRVSLVSPIYEVSSGQIRNAGVNILGEFELTNRSYDLKKTLEKKGSLTLVTYTVKNPKWSNIQNQEVLVRQSFAMLVDANSRVVEVAVGESKNGTAKPVLIFMKQKNWELPSF